MADGPDLRTNAITSYDGIFKSIHDPEIRKDFLKVRKLLSSGKWGVGKILLQDTLIKSSFKPFDRKCLTLILNELQRYEDNKISPNTAPARMIAWDTVVERDLTRIIERFCEFPQSVFFLDVGRSGLSSSRRLVGRKILSDYWIAGKIPELHCSLVTADMLLGLYCDERITENEVHVHYYPLNNAEKLKLFSDIMAGDSSYVEIICPFPLLRESDSKELCSPAEGWEVDDAYDVMLSCGEERLKQYTIQFLETIDMTTGRFYDPACSTGMFLSTLKEAFPESYTIGQDLSQQMADFSKERVDEVYCGNAMLPKILTGTADACFIRFLNSEVVTSAEAEVLLSALLPTVREKGFIVIFGHTPVLLSSSNFRRLSNFRLIQSVGVSTDKTGIFQYYIIQRDI
ncbi:isonocardicin synthase-like [Ylistrum balloti]|uniref:isonocardicin synthase-like n=1 Tax=Ylistrum balloti TaxID=509963 RepID=UPI002905C430|nr:isonocardicin synthase-like [Ylistrum balloti]